MNRSWRQASRGRAVGRRVFGFGLATASLAVLLGGVGLGLAQTPPAAADLTIAAAGARRLDELGVVVFEQRVEGTAGVALAPSGDLDGAPVVGDVFPTSLPPATVGFAASEGILALAATSHPDFDDTPLWDEEGDGDYADDGAVYHAHWAVLVPDERVTGGLAVMELGAAEAAVLPPTNAGLPLFLDSPGYPVVLDGAELRVVVPIAATGGETGFTFDAVTAELVVNTADAARPLLGVETVYSVLSGDLSLPATVVATGSALPRPRPLGGRRGG
jgi:hypothetical protein